MILTLFDSGSISDLQVWAEEFNIRHPVAADPAMAVGTRFNPDRVIPSMTLLGPGLEVIARDRVFTESEILDYL